MKKQAEAFLIEECPNLRPVIIRPGKVVVRSFVNTFLFEFSMKRNYSDMSDVCEVISNQIDQIYKDEDKQEGEGRIANTDPVFIGWEEIRQVIIDQDKQD